MYGDYLQFAAGDLIAVDPATRTTKENKVFERTLVDVPEDAPDRWGQIAVQIPGKAPEDIHLHYLLLLHAINLIDSGGVDLPLYESEYGDMWPDTSATADQQVKEGRKKGVPWSEDEHRRFLEGLERFGRGDWRNISRCSVKTRTPTQVASHAQKYYLRQSVKKESKKKSIHDIGSSMEKLLCAVGIAAPY